jgi:hypothetical protein
MGQLDSTRAAPPRRGNTGYSARKPRRSGRSSCTVKSKGLKPVFHFIIISGSRVDTNQARFQAVWSHWMQRVQPRHVGVSRYGHDVALQQRVHALQLGVNERRGVRHFDPVRRELEGPGGCRDLDRVLRRHLFFTKTRGGETLLQVKRWKRSRADETAT